MSLNCPRCGSHRLTHDEPGRRFGSRFGALTGASIAVITVLRPVTQVAAVAASFVAGPGGVLANNVANALMAALFAGSAGGAVGGALGKLADQSFLDNYKCLDCGCTFRSDGDEQAPHMQPAPQGPAGPRFSGDVDRFYGEDR